MLKKKLVVYDPETYRPYCHVNDFSRIINKIINSPMKKVNNEIFNCGSKVNNFNKYGVVKVLKKYFPKGEVFFLKKGTKDKRNYLVNFSKIEKKLKIKSKHNISYGIREILINRKKYKWLEASVKLKSIPKNLNMKYFRDTHFRVYIPNKMKIFIISDIFNRFKNIITNFFF